MANKSKKEQFFDLIDNVILSMVDLYTIKGSGYVVVPENPTQIYSIDSTFFSGWLQWFFVDYGNKNNKRHVITSTLLKEILDYIKAKAAYLKQETDYNLRTARLNGTFYYDIGDGKTLLKIENGEVEIINPEKSPVLFLGNNNSYAAQVIPDLDNSSIKDINLLDKYLNIKTDRDRVILLAYIISLLDPSINKYCPYIYGVQGSAKSTTLKLIRSLIDPANTRKSDYSRDAKLELFKSSIEDIARIMASNYCCFFDNLSYMKKETSDNFASIITGADPSFRKYYTNMESIVIDKNPCFAFTGINIAVTNADLLQRSLLIEVERIPQNKYVKDSNFWNNFHSDKPKIFGAIVKIFAMASKKRFLSDKKLELPRMADHAELMAFIAQVMGYDNEVFISCINDNTNEQNENAVNFSVVGRTIKDFIKGLVMDWEGSATQLYDELVKSLPEHTKVGNKYSNFPDSVEKMGKQINLIIGNLNDLGYYLEKTRDMDGTKYILGAKTKIKDEEDYGLPI